MIKSQISTRARFPRTGDVVLYGGSIDTDGKVREVPAMILDVQTPGDVESRVDLQTIRIGLDAGIHGAVPFVKGPEQGCWRWRPIR